MRRGLVLEGWSHSFRVTHAFQEKAENNKTICPSTALITMRSRTPWLCQRCAAFLPKLGSHKMDSAELILSSVLCLVLPLSCETLPSCTLPSCTPPSCKPQDKSGLGNADVMLPCLATLGINMMDAVKLMCVSFSKTLFHHALSRTRAMWPMSCSLVF